MVLWIMGREATSSGDLIAHLFVGTGAAHCLICVKGGCEFVDESEHYADLSTGRKRGVSLVCRWPPTTVYDPLAMSLQFKCPSVYKSLSLSLSFLADKNFSALQPPSISPGARRMPAAAGHVLTHCRARRLHPVQASAL